MLIVPIVFHGPEADRRQQPRGAVAWLLSTVVLMLAAKPAVTRWIIRTATLEQSNIVADIRPPTVDSSKIVVLCARSDDVRGWLRMCDAVAQTPFAVGCVLLSVVGFGAQWSLPVIVDWAMQSTLGRGLAEIHIAGFDGWALVVGSVMLCVAWGLVLLCSSVLQWPGCWRAPLLTNALVRIDNDIVPQSVTGNSHVACAFDVPAPPVRSRRTHGYLRHTAICDEPSVIRAIGSWLANKQSP